MVSYGEFEVMSRGAMNSIMLRLGRGPRSLAKSGFLTSRGPEPWFECQVVDAGQTSVNSNAFGPVSYAFVKINGPMGIFSLGASEEVYWVKWVPDSTALPSEVNSTDDIPFLILKRDILNNDVFEGIALNCVGEESHTFMRVGYVLLRCRGDDWESWVTDILKVSRKLITII
jgi:hypothetical protein